MSASLMLEGIHVVPGIDAVADAFASTVSSDVVNASHYESVCFLIHNGVGATGVSTITIESCDDVSPTTSTAVAFTSRSITTNDAEGAITARAAAGFLTTAGSSDIYLCEVKSSELSGTDKYVRATMVESVDSPVLGGIIILMGNPRYNQDTKIAAIT